MTRLSNFENFLMNFFLLIKSLKHRFCLELLQLCFHAEESLKLDSKKFMKRPNIS